MVSVVDDELVVSWSVEVVRLVSVVVAVVAVVAVVSEVVDPGVDPVVDPDVDCVLDELPTVVSVVLDDVDDTVAGLVVGVVPPVVVTVDAGLSRLLGSAETVSALSSVEPSNAPEVFPVVAVVEVSSIAGPARVSDPIDDESTPNGHRSERATPGSSPMRSSPSRTTAVAPPSDLSHADRVAVQPSPSPNPSRPRAGSAGIAEGPGRSGGASAPRMACSGTEDGLDARPGPEPGVPDLPGVVLTAPGVPDPGWPGPWVGP